MNFDWILIKEPLLQWYENDHRNLPWRNTNNPYYVWISEIMLQQTRVEAVKEYYRRFLKAVPNVELLAEIQEEDLLKLWEGLGYYNRARNMQKAAQIIMERYQGDFPTEYSDVIGLPGIGEYTAGAICSICYNQPTPAVDGNVLRVMTRVSESDCNIDDAKTKKLAKLELEVLYQHGDCGTLTQALMELGAMICVPNGNPRCELCPLGDLCKARKNSSFHRLPVRKDKKQRKIQEMTVFVLHDDTYYGIRKRPSTGLLANMWEFSHVDYQMNKKEALQYISEQGYEPVSLEKEIPYTHIFTHKEWRMTAYYISCRNRLPELTWVDLQEFETAYALPTAFKVFIEKEF